VSIDYQTVRPRQRIWDDVEEEIRERYGWGESLRAIKASLDRLIGSSLGLRTINERVHALATLVPRWHSRQQTECPPVVRLDGVWVPQMQATGKYQNDALGRQRPVKSGTRRPLLVAQGVWPASGRQEIVAWVLRDAEGREDWLALLNQMWERGLRPQRGLKLLAADGNAGLPGAHQEVYWNVPLQRCVFHKLRNIWRDLVVPSGLASKAAKAYKRRLIRSAARVWQAARLSTARERHTAWCLTWESEQPDAVATMRRDFEATVTFYDVQTAAKRRDLMWPATHLRTTSHIERLFRVVRRRIRQAIVLHSSTGVLALAHQCFTRWTAGQATSLHERSTWPRQLERALAALAIS
jgi:transposase-like protein